MTAPIKEAYDNGWTPQVPTQPGQKYPGFKDWQHFVMTPELLAKSVAAGRDTFGLLTKNFPCVDIDVTNAALVTKIKQIAFDELGPAPCRTGSAPKCALAYRTDTPFAKRWLTILHKSEDKPWRVEILGDGQQYVFMGHHPSGVDYTWDESPADVPADALTTITAEDADRFLRVLSEKFDPAVWTVKLSSSKEASPTTPTSDVLAAPSIEDVRTLVAETPNLAIFGWDEMMNFARAVKGASRGSAEGLLIFQQWCERWEGGVSSTIVQLKAWEGDPTVGWDWLMKLAEDHGASTIMFDFDCPVVGMVGSVVSNKSFTWSDVATADGVANWMATQDEYNYVAFDRNRNSWHCHDEGRWSGPSGNQRGSANAYRAINPTLERMHTWFAAQPTPIDAKAKKAAAKALGNLQSTTFADLVRHAMERTGHWDFDINDLDSPARTAHLLNTPDGTYNFRTQTLEPFDPLNYITRQTRVSIKNDDSKMPLFLDLLKKVTNNTEEVDFLQRFFGSALNAETNRKVMLVMHGQSNSGKTTIVEVIARGVLRNSPGDYACPAPSNVLLRKPNARDEPHPTGLHSIMEARLATLMEIGTDQRWNEHTIKSLTGRDSISVRRIYGDPESLQFHGRLVVTANTKNLPQTDVVDSGTRKRMLFMSLNPVSEAELNKDGMRQIEQDEAPYIFGWLLRGYAKDLTRPVDNRAFVPQTLIEDTEELLEEGDPVSSFVEEMLTVGGDTFTATSDILDAFADFCLARGYDRGRIQNSRSMGHALREIEALQGMKHDTTKARGWRVRINTKRMDGENRKAAIEDLLG